MRFSRLTRILSVLLIMTLLSCVMPAAASEDKTVLDAAELDALLSEFEPERSLDDEHFGLAYYYTGTGESYFYNEDFSTYAASLYKVPLCMCLAEKVDSGELELTERIGGYTVEDIISNALIYSSNKHALAGFAAVGNSRSERWAALNSYSGISAEELPERYTDGFFTTEFMLNTLLTLYNEPERFPGVLENMEQANPDYYFRRTLEGQYTVAQKYGNISNNGLYYMHAAGIIYTPTPFILVVMTVNVHDSYELLGELAELFAEYTLTLDERVAAIPEPTPTPEPTAEPTPEPSEEPAEVTEPDDSPNTALILAAGAVAAIGCGAIWIRKRRKNKST